ncbi:MAG: PQQ-dependent sugar dehydrogenase, partial [Polyangiales bacterium]
PDGASTGGTAAPAPTGGGAAGSATSPGGRSGGSAPSGAAGTPASGGAGGSPSTGGGPASGGAAGAAGEASAAGSGGTSGAAGAGPTMTAASTCSAPAPSTMVGNTCPGTPPPAIKLTEVAKGLTSPTFMAQAPGDPTRFYVLEQQGTIRIIKDGMLQPEPFIDLRDMNGAAATVNSDMIIPGQYAEGGLLGAVFDPRFAETKRLWLSYTKPGPAYSVGEFVVENPDKLDVTNYKELVTFPQYGFFPGGGATNHVGSMLAFGPDGCMYISRGDGGGEMDRQMSGQKTSDDLCSILRIDVDKYPTAAPGNLDGHVWNYGFRNPWRFSFDRTTGDMYIGDVGQDTSTGFEEINVEPRGVMGRNYGWSVAEGSTVCRGDCSMMSKPALEYGITANENSVIGGYVYRGKKIPELVGRYIWADWSARVLKSFVYKGDNAGQAEICDEHDLGITSPEKVRSFAEDNDGEIYVVTGGEPSGMFESAGLAEPGTLFRIDPM